ncbi:MAG: DNA-directed RNA polymerase subunit L [Desulfurococcaceae archaeon]|nr:DNA-directed RNA polymerase subunit L [Desulfurococcaceae archaeon]
MEVRVVSKTDRELVLEIVGEDHTLGNMLMKEALKHPNVEYAAYRIPHPLRNIMEFTIIVKEGASLSNVLAEIISKLKSEVSKFKKLIEEVLE